MTASVLTPCDARIIDVPTPGPTGPSLGLLHDRAAGVDEALLPCRVNDPDLWFAESPSDVEFAKALCLDCPVRELCLGGALDRREPWGVWGGELFLQGVVIPRKRPRGRPRKNEVAA
ncbi:WhiB family transcriptional regulator [Nocardioides sp.]|uniref:WhiB family transcriptional regulator n=1 Tax=Nocardioides sp. TaxID=35761 RepID=UPI003512A62C